MGPLRGTAGWANTQPGFGGGGDARLGSAVIQGGHHEVLGPGGQQVGWVWAVQVPRRRPFLTLGGLQLDG